MEESRTCPQCHQILGPKTRLIREEECGHLKCRTCLLDEEDGCSQCVKENFADTEQLYEERVEEQEIHDDERLEEETQEEDSKRYTELQPVYEIGYEIIDVPSSSAVMIQEISHEVQQEEERIDESHTEQEDVEEQTEEQYIQTNTAKVIRAPTKPNPSHVVEIQLTNEQTDETERAYRCNLCRKTFKSIHQIRYHTYCDTNVEKPLKCAECGKDFRTNYQLKQHIQLHSGEFYQCTVCDRKFAHDASAKKHYKTHFSNYNEAPVPKRLPSTGEHPCHECGKVFARKDYLKKHMICHTDLKRYQCSICHKKYMRFNALKFHIQSTHEKCEEYACNTCYKAFSSLQSLQRHTATHENIARVACKICGLRSTRKDNLMRHIRSFHPDEDQRTSILHIQDEVGPEEEMDETETALDQLNTIEIRSKEAHLRKNVIVSAKQEVFDAPTSVESSGDDSYMAVDSLQDTIVVLGMSSHRETVEETAPTTTTTNEEKKVEPKPKLSKKLQAMELYRKILMEQEDAE